MLKNMNSGIVVLASILICGLLVGCGPSAAEQASTSAALTAAAATDTPVPTATPIPTDTPTPTSTPVPYDLSLIVSGEEDVPILGAVVILVGDARVTDKQITDEVGQVFWSNLPGEIVNISMSAQGYFTKDVTETIERGINQRIVALNRDPHGLLPSEACGLDEKLLYIEDFQDGDADRLESIRLKASGWDLGPHPDSQGNIVAMYNGEYGGAVELTDGDFVNAVWRIRFMTDSRRVISFNWLKKLYQTGDVDGSAYSAFFEPGWLDLGRVKWPVSHTSVLGRKIFISPKKWHQIEMSTYEGDFEFWLNGARLLLYEDPEPLTGGNFDIGYFESPGVDFVDYFDNISVCELNAPYVPMPTLGS